MAKDNYILFGGLAVAGLAYYAWMSKKSSEVDKQMSDNLDLAYTAGCKTAQADKKTGIPKQNLEMLNKTAAFLTEGLSVQDAANIKNKYIRGYTECYSAV